VPERQERPSALFLSESWLESPTELSFVTRVLAGAASRSGDVTMAVPAPADFSQADGAFDLVGIGGNRCWPGPSQVTWPIDPRSTTIVVDTWSDELATLMSPTKSNPISTVLPTEGIKHVQPLRFTPDVNDPTTAFLGLHVPVNQLASQHRHNGLGFTDYLLVLTDRSGPVEADSPTDIVAWLTAAFHSTYVVVVENARASAWLGRVRRGTVAVDTRMDLWRLLAHARVTIDAAPGPVVARECVESLRFGTPIIVPQSSAAASHARAGGGSCFADVAGLLEGVDAVMSAAKRATFSVAGKVYAEEHYGDAGRFVRGVAAALWPTPR
jgi:hypothetical protein